jgi:hypothetical protein
MKQKTLGETKRQRAPQVEEREAPEERWEQQRARHVEERKGPEEGCEQQVEERRGLRRSTIVS